MVMPTKIVKPVDSLIAISAYIIQIIKNKNMNIDDLLDALNQAYYKKIDIRKLLMCLDFLFMCGKIRNEDDVIKLNL